MQVRCRDAVRGFACADASGHGRQACLVDRAALLHDVPAGLCRGVEAVRVAGLGQEAERALAGLGVHGVDRETEPVGEIAADGGFAPRARLARQNGRQARRVPHRPGGPAVRAGGLATNRPSWVRISTWNARKPASRVHPCHEGPAR